MYAIIPAAGQGLRFGGPINKQFQSLKGRPLLLYTLEVFEKTPEVEGVCVVVPAPEVKSTAELLKRSNLKKIIRVVGLMRFPIVTLWLSMMGFVPSFPLS